MTPELQVRIEKSLPPFDYDCVRDTEGLSLLQLRAILSMAFDSLSCRYPDVHIFDDWHEHDGFITNSKPQSWELIECTLASDRSLFDSRDEGDEVRIAIYSTNFDWIIRYNIDQGDVSDYRTAICQLDVSITDKTELKNVINSLLAQFQDSLTRCKSKPWFISRYGG